MRDARSWRPRVPLLPVQKLCLLPDYCCGGNPPASAWPTCCACFNSHCDAPFGLMEVPTYSERKFRCNYSIYPVMVGTDFQSTAVQAA